MDKNELIEQTARKTGLSKNQAGQVLNAVLEEIIKTLSKGEEVALTGFGRFSVAQRKERQGVNPKTREKIKIPAGKAPKFKAGKILKDAVK